MTAAEIARKARARLAPPQDILPSEWANEHRRLSPEASARPGRFRIEKTPFMREPMDCLKDPECDGFDMKKSSQVAYTELLNNIIAYKIDVDPAPMMLMQPTLEMAESYSKDRISPMIRDTPALAARIDDKSKTSGNTILHKKFPGGLLQMVGANSPSSLASRPMRDLFCDEVDRFPGSAKDEGDPIKLAEKRQITFFDRIRIRGGTPTVKNASRICKSFDLSDQSKYMVGCPRCGDHIALEPGQFQRDTKAEHFGEYQCQACQGFIEHHEKFDMIKDRPMGGTAFWQPTKPEFKRRGFFIWAAYSPFMTWLELCEEWNECEGDPELEQTFYNTILGLEYEYSTQELDHSALFARREDYDGDRVPEPVAIITCGIDTQDDRFELEVVGWGPGEESWSLDYVTINGDPSNKETRDELDDYLKTSTFRRVDGEELHISCAFIDTGGHRTDDVYSFVRGKQFRKIFGCKGASSPGQPVFARWSKLKEARIKLALIGTDTAKESIYARLSIDNEDQRGRCHFPLSYSEQYFKGLIAEERKIEWVKGQPKVRWVKKKDATKRNEPLDVRVYALAALRSMPMGSRLAKMRKREREVRRYELKEGEVRSVECEGQQDGAGDDGAQKLEKPTTEKKSAAKKGGRRGRRRRPGGGGWSAAAY